MAATYHHKSQFRMKCTPHQIVLVDFVAGGVTWQSRYVFVDHGSMLAESQIYSLKADIHQHNTLNEMIAFGKHILSILHHNKTLSANHQQIYNNDHFLTAHAQTCFHNFCFINLCPAKAIVNGPKDLTIFIAPAIQKL